MQTTPRPTESTITPSLDSEFRRVHDLEIWEFVAPLVEKACQRSNGKLSPEWVFGRVANGLMQLWLGTKDGKIAVLVLTEITQYDATRALSIVAVTGKDRDGWIEHVETLKAYAKSIGCKTLEAWARPGWERILKDWKKTHVLLEIEL